MHKLRSVLVGVTLGCATNSALFLLASAAGLFGESLIAKAAKAPLTVAAVLFATLAGIIAAVAVRFLLGALFTRPGRARRWFLGLAALCLTLSFLSPIHGIVGATKVEILILEVMHVLAALAAVYSAEWANRPEWRFGSRAYDERPVSPRTALVTGATSGIGAEVALELARRGFAVIGIGRSQEKARAIEAASGNIRILIGDLSLMREAKRLASLVSELASTDGIGVLVHCAGTLKPRSSPTTEGVDANFAASFLGRFALTEALRLPPGCRVVNVAAAEHGQLPGSMRMQLGTPEDIGSGMRSHGQAQLANDLLTASLARRGIGAYGYGPGSVDTAIRRELPPVLTSLLQPVFAVDTRAPAEAALDVVRLLLDRALPPSGFASRNGPFAHDPFILDAARQESLLHLARILVEKALANSGSAT